MPFSYDPKNASPFVQNVQQLPPQSKVPGGSQTMTHKHANVSIPRIVFDMAQCLTERLTEALIQT